MATFNRRPAASHVARAAAIVASIALAGCVAPRPAAPGGPRAHVPASVRVRVGGRIEQVPLETYVLGSALSEVVPLGESAATTERMYEVQAILARTFAAAHIGRHAAEGFDLCDTVHCQLYQPSRINTSRFAAIARQAVEATRGEILWYDGRPAEALYSADCGGITDSPDRVWGTAPVPYLPLQRDDAPGVTHGTWTLTLDGDALRAALDADPRTSVGRRLAAIRVAERDASGRAEQVALTGERSPTVAGDVFRQVLNLKLPGQGLESTRFTVSQRANRYEFTGSGNGHGVGLCERGALAWARRGTPAAVILGKYFPGTDLRTDQAPRAPMF